MITKTSYLFSLSCLFLSCKNESQEISKLNTNKAPAELLSAKNPPVYFDVMSPESTIMDHLKSRRAEIELLLKGTDGEESNNLFYSLMKENDSALVLLSYEQEALLEKYAEYDECNLEKQIYTMNLPAEVGKLVEDYRKAGVEFWQVGEGMTVLRMFPDYYFDLFKRKVTPDYQTYLAMIAEEEKVLWVSDAAIIISWQELSERVVQREQFLRDYPTSKLSSTVKDELQGYRYAYLLGYDNTQTTEQGAYNPENLVEFNRFVKANPESETTKIIKEMSSKVGDREKLFDFVTKKIGYETQY